MAVQVQAVEEHDAENAEEDRKDTMTEDFGNDVYRFRIGEALMLGFIRRLLLEESVPPKPVMFTYSAAWERKSRDVVS